MYVWKAHAIQCCEWIEVNKKKKKIKKSDDIEMNIYTCEYRKWKARRKKNSHSQSVTWINHLLMQWECNSTIHSMFMWRTKKKEKETVDGTYDIPTVIWYCADHWNEREKRFGEMGMDVSGKISELLEKNLFFSLFLFQNSIFVHFLPMMKFWRLIKWKKN